MITPVVLVGGSGSRLWPVSLPGHPKQFAPLIGRHSLFRQTLDRVSGETTIGGPRFAPPLIVGALRHRQRITGELAAAGLSGSRLILEPFGRNTAPAIAVAALDSADRPETLLLVLPSDHHVRDVAAFHGAVACAAAAAKSGRLVTFGIVPTRPETGYGYIRRGPARGDWYEVDRFIEKPPLADARAYVGAGDHDWNAGIFLFTAGAILNALERLAPDVLGHARAAIAAAKCDAGASVLDATEFARCPSISIDDAVMAKAATVAVVPVEMGWSDVGSWQALHMSDNRDQRGNVLRGHVIAADVERSYLRADDGLIAAIGVRDIAVVRSGGSVLVTPLGRAQEVRAIDQRLAAPELRGGRPSPLPPVFSPAARRFADWMTGDALPLWAERGWDRDRPGFREQLGPDGTPVAEPFRRVRVQARQIYVFAAAHLMNWTGPALDLAWRGFERLVANAWLEDGGWAHRLDVDGQAIDRTRDTYDHAFVLFALAWLHRASGDEAPLVWARRTLAWLDAVLVDPVHGGYLESLPASLARRANPHMHLVEALIALYDATRDPSWLDRCRPLIDLLRDRFIDRNTGSLREFFEADWSAATGDPGRIREPGHHYEWSWLLDAWEARSGEPCGADIDLLAGFARRHGTSDRLGLVFNGVDDAGRRVAPGHRVWTQTEAIRARLMLADRGGEGEAEAAAGLLEALFRHHLGTDPAGLWNDRLDGDGRPISDTVPASTLYHLMTLYSDIHSRLDDDG